MNFKSKRTHFGVVLVSMFFTVVGHSASNCETLNQEISDLKQASVEAAEVRKALFNPIGVGLKSVEAKRMQTDLITSAYNRQLAIDGQLKFLMQTATTHGCLK